MKMILTAIALTIAAPAMAQTTPAANPHAGHNMAGHEGHAGHQGHAMPAENTADPHAGHDMSGDCCEKTADGEMACCEKAKDDGKAADCCEKKAGEKAAVDPHAGHDMSAH